MAPIARLLGVTRSYDRQVAVRDLSLELQPGVIHGLLGPNGAGKSTTLRVLMGVAEPDRGTVELFGEPPSDRGRARVGYVPEARALPEDYRVRELLVFIARMRGHDLAGGKRRADNWIERLQLTEQADLNVGALSNGQQQKVQIALAMLCEPELLLLDEPLTALDPRHQDLVFACVREAAEQGTAVVISTHRLREAEAILQHIFLIADGKLVLDGNLQQTLDDTFDGTWRVRATGDTSWVQGDEVLRVSTHGPDLHVKLRPGAGPTALLARAATAPGRLLAIEALVPGLHDLFITKVGEDPDPQATAQGA